MNKLNNAWLLYQFAWEINLMVMRVDKELPNFTCSSSEDVLKYLKPLDFWALGVGPPVEGPSPAFDIELRISATMEEKWLNSTILELNVKINQEKKRRKEFQKKLKWGDYDREMIWFRERGKFWVILSAPFE